MDLEEIYDEEVSQLFQKYAGRVRGYLINMGADSAVVDEFVVDAFLITRRRWVDVRDYDYPPGYPFRVAEHLWWRHAKYRYAHEEPQAEPGLWADAWYDPGQDVADAMDLRAALQELPRRLRQVVILRHVQMLSVEETAGILGIGPGTVKRYTHEGLSLNPPRRNS
jgi:RNA polymerase sigma factor (sigma-70 family)